MVAIATVALDCPARLAGTGRGFFLVQDTRHHRRHYHGAAKRVVCGDGEKQAVVES